MRVFPFLASKSVDITVVQVFFRHPFLGDTVYSRLPGFSGSSSLSNPSSLALNCRSCIEDVAVGAGPSR